MLHANRSKCLKSKTQEFKTAAPGVCPRSHLSCRKALRHSVTPGGVLFSEYFKVAREGYIKIHRVIQEHPIKKDHNAFLLFLDLLINAEWKDGKQAFFKGKQITLKRGQLVAGRHQLATSTGIPPSTVRDSLKRLTKSKWQICDIEPDKEYTLITILNYSRYQDISYQPDIKPDSNPTATRQQPDTLEALSIKHLRNKKNIKNKDVSSCTPSLTDKEFIDFLKSNPAYKDIDIDIELSKMDAWLLTRPGRKKTKRFILNWLNRIDNVLPNSNGKYTPSQIKTALRVEEFKEKHKND